MGFPPWSLARIRLSALGPRSDSGHSIYALVDPRDDRIRYIGYTSRELAKRLKTHLVRPVGRATDQWFRELTAAGLSPEIRLIVSTTADNWERDEMRWIAWARSFGRLLNVDPGGEYRGAGARVKPAKKRLARNIRRQFEGEILGPRHQRDA